PQLHSATLEQTVDGGRVNLEVGGDGTDRLAADVSGHGVLLISLAELADVGVPLLHRRSPSEWAAPIIPTSPATARLAKSRSHIVALDTFVAGRYSGT